MMNAAFLNRPLDQARIPTQMVQRGPLSVLCHSLHCGQGSLEDLSCPLNPGGFPSGAAVKNPPVMQKTQEP